MRVVGIDKHWYGNKYSLVALQKEEATLKYKGREYTVSKSRNSYFKFPISQASFIVGSDVPLQDIVDLYYDEFVEQLLEELEKYSSPYNKLLLHNRDNADFIVVSKHTDTTDRKGRRLPVILNTRRELEPDNVIHESVGDGLIFHIMDDDYNPISVDNGLPYIVTKDELYALAKDGNIKAIYFLANEHLIGTNNIPLDYGMAYVWFNVYCTLVTDINIDVAREQRSKLNDWLLSAKCINGYQSMSSTILKNIKINNETVNGELRC